MLDPYLGPLALPKRYRKSLLGRLAKFHIGPVPTTLLLLVRHYSATLQGCQASRLVKLV